MKNQQIYVPLIFAFFRYFAVLFILRFSDIS